jgi:hypothetical protein
MNSLLLPGVSFPQGVAIERRPDANLVSRSKLKFKVMNSLLLPGVSFPQGVAIERRPDANLVSRSKLKI